MKTILLLLALASLAGASTIFCADNSSILYACATFSAQGSNLVVELRNTSLYDVLKPEEVLTAVFWDSGVPLTLTPVSAILASGSFVVYGIQDPGGVVGGEWSYASNLMGAPFDSKYGISSAGFGLFGSANFPGNNLQGPNSVDGLQYGITSLGDNTSTGNTPVTGGNSLIKNGVVFTLSGLPQGFDTSSIYNVSFQYGTSLNEPNISNIPEPGTISYLLLGLGMLLADRKIS